VLRGWDTENKGETRALDGVEASCMADGSLSGGADVSRDRWRIGLWGGPEGSSIGEDRRSSGAYI
jgi:hypothetical protein